MVPLMSNRALVLSLAALVACGGSSANQPPPPQPAPATTTAAVPVAAPPAPDAEHSAMPLWSDVKTGKLANGLTYFILPHHKPENRAFLWLAVNAGSVLEDEDQRGLAHFDEHMAFNGTKRFPKNDLVHYLQSIGMRFGADLNAYTSFDETVYQLEVPTDKPEFLDKGFDILRDWAGDATYDPKEVEGERGVVREEWRLGRGANQRIRDKQVKVLFAGSRYGSHNPIGDVDIIDHAARDTLYRFYKDWYRPDLMGVVVVGEVDPAQIETMIKAKFGDLKNPASERARFHAEPVKADGMRVSIETDREAVGISVGVSNLIPVRSRISLADDKRLVAEQLYNAIINERFATLRRKADAPFIGAGAQLGRFFVRDVDAFQRFAQAKPDHVDDALRALFTEALRLERHGITQSELDRARTNLSRQYEEAEAQDSTSSSHEFAGEVVRYFLEQELMIGRKTEREIAEKTLPTITVDQLNQLAASFGGDNNRVITISGPEGKPLPSEADVRRIVAEVAKTEIPAWQDAAPTQKLMDAAPAPGKIVKEKKIDKIGVTEWTLSNGARVVIKPTDFEADQVTLDAWSPGGEAVAKDADYKDIRWALPITQTGGVGQFDSDALTKVLAGKQVRVSPQIHDYSETVSGSASPKDLETMFQLLYLRFTQPRFDAEQIAVFQKNTAQQLTNIGNNPEFQFNKQSTAAEYKNNPRQMFPEPGELDKIDAKKAFEFYKSRFGDATDFTFVLVGAFDVDKLRPLVETYLASLPAKGRKEVEKDIGIRRVSGVVKKEWKIGQAPKAQVQLDFHAPETWSRDKERDIYILGQLLTMRLIDSVREEKSGVYGINASGSFERSPYQQHSFVVRFGCDPKRVDELIKAVYDEIAGVVKDPGDGYLDKVRETFTRTRETDLRTNKFWAEWLTRAYHYGDDPTIVLDLDAVRARITAKNVSAAAKRFLDSKSVYQGVLLPADSPAATPAAAAPAPAAPAPTPAPAH
jgi:zinc protease